MNADSLAVRPGILGKAFALLCVATFWAVPLSPFVAIAAIATTRNAAGWPRFLAKTGAVLCILSTCMLAALFLWIVFVIYIVRGGDFAC